MNELLRASLILLVASGVTAFLAPSPVTRVALDQATVKPGAHLDQLSAGRYVLGTKFDSQDHLGEVVVVNIGGA
jgi:hypothetical protein